MLSDACFDFLGRLAKGQDKGEATRELIRATIWYDRGPGKPWQYGPELGILRETAQCYADQRTDTSYDRLLRTASAVMQYHDDPNARRPFAAHEQVVQPEVVDAATLAPIRSTHTPSWPTRKKLYSVLLPSKVAR
jgi:hypothetical protein